MSFYEIAAEEKGYFYFHRGALYAPPHFHGAMELIFVEKGEQEVIVGGEKRVLRAGEACFCNAFCVHSYADASAVGYAVLYTRECFERYFALFEDKTPPRFFPFNDFELLHSLLNLSHKSQGNDVALRATMEGIVGVLLGAIAAQIPFAPRKTDRQNALVCDVLQYAHERLASDLSLTALAQTFGYSSRYLARVLTKSLSENWTDYVNRLRARRAHALLAENPTLPVLEIAFACGFESANTFYRAYKKVFHHAPRRGN